MDIDESYLAAQRAPATSSRSPSSPHGPFSSRAVSRWSRRSSRMGIA